jgi:hypothetical protein
MTMQRWRGLKALVQDAVEHGSRAVERVHLATARRPFAILEAIPVVATPTRIVHVIHDATTSTVYGSIRLVNRAVGATLDVALDAADAREEPHAPEEG